MASKVGHYPIEIVKGDTFSLRFTYNTKDCSTGVLTPVDLTNVTSVEAKVLDTSNAELIVMTGTVADAANGIITVSLTDVQTATLVGPSASKPVETIGSWYARLNWLDGTVQTLLRGKVSLTSVEGA